MRDPGRGAGLQRRPHRLARRRLARDGRRDDGRPPVWLVDAGRVQRVGRDPGGPPRCRRRRGRRVDVAGADGLEPRRRRLVGPQSEDRRALADRAAGHLGRGDREGVEHHPRAARRLLARVDHARDRRDRRRQVRAGDRPGHAPGRRDVRGRRGAAPRHVRGAARRAQACIHRGRSRDGRELEPDRRRRRRDARRQRGCRRPARADAAGTVRVVRDRRRRSVPDAPRQPAGLRAGAHAAPASAGTTWP